MKKRKLALVGFRLNKGGAERVMAILSNYFHDKGIEVHNIIVIDDIGYPYMGKVLNLGKLKNKSNGFFNKIKRLVALRNYLKKHEFDYIIDFRFRSKLIQEFIISRFVYTTRTIYTVHHFKIHEYMPNFSPLTRLMYGHSYAIISISTIMENIIKERHKLKNVVTIYNPINVNYISKMANVSVNLDFEYIISVGQYDNNLKQFDKLIEAYAASSLPNKKIALVILGTGKLKNLLIDIAKNNNVSELVHLLGFQTNPFKYINKAKYFVLSSKQEGLPMVLLEALACVTPIVSFDCPTGPREIVIDKVNGLLIENQNFKKLKEGMDTLIDDEYLYAKCKNNTLKSADKFSIDTIGKQWLNLLNLNS